jgi:hypothetical protein
MIPPEVRDTPVQHMAMNKKSKNFWLLGSTLALQLALLAMTMPLSEILSEEPLFHIDNAAHWYRMKTAVNFAADGNLIGYDPFFNGGTTSGIFANPAAKVPAAMAILSESYLNEVQV